MNSSFIPILMVLIGGLFVYAGFTGNNPVAIVKAALTP